MSEHGDRPLGAGVTEPRTIAGRAALTGTRPHIRRWLAQTISTIEKEAVTPYAEALKDADLVLRDLAAADPAAEWSAESRASLVENAQAAHRVVEPLLERRDTES